MTARPRSQKKLNLNRFPAHTSLKALGIRKAAFLVAFKEVGNITHAAKLAGVSRRSHFQWLKNDPQYCIDYGEAQQEALENLEAEAYRRAVQGVVEPVYGSGGTGVGTVQVGQIRKYSDVLLIFMLKGANPEKYRDRIDTKISGAIGAAGMGVSLQEIMDALDEREQQKALTVEGQVIEK